MDQKIRQALRQLPAVDEVLRGLPDHEWPHWALVRAVRDYIAEARQLVLAGEEPPEGPGPDEIERRVAALIVPSLRPVINATGVVLHTNLGRAPLSAAVMERISQVAAGYSNLEYELSAKGRGSRHGHAAGILRELSGAEDAVVVNNNAAAVLLCLSALASEREVIVSRGELIEIGGSFRLPDVMSASGAILREVGTTNRTHARDYEQAIGEETALLLRVHRSNFAIVGFTAEVAPETLVAMGRQRQLPTMFDLGSGSLIDLAEVGLPQEMTVPQAVACGFDLVTFSGDKMLGGPQAGIIVGRAELVARLRAHPLMRPLRPDKMTLAGLVATLEEYRDGAAVERIPALTMLGASNASLKKRATRLRGQLRRLLPAPWEFSLIQVSSRVGGGSLPEAAPSSWAVAISSPGRGANTLEALLRRGDPPVIARIDKDQLFIDVRTLWEQPLGTIAKHLASALGG